MRHGSVLSLYILLKLPFLSGNTIDLIRSDEGLTLETVANKQLLDEVKHDIMNYQTRGLCYLPKPKAEADNTDKRS